MLLLKRHLVQLVREGKKRQTIRLWSRPIVRPNQISYTPGLGRMKILTVETVDSLDALTEEDAHADGFATRAALLAEIKKIYGPVAPQKSQTRKPQKKSLAGASPKPSAAPNHSRTLFRIRFQWPIDAAGEKLVLAPATPPPEATKSVAAHHPSPIAAPAAPNPPSALRTPTYIRSRSALPHHVSANGMSPAQRQSLRAYVLSRAPSG